jgi:hypothetical protein
MRLVDRPEWSPHYCAISLKDDDPEGFIDTEMNLPVVEPHIFVAVSSARELGRFVGMVDGSEHAKTAARLEAAMGEIARLNERLSDKQEQLDAVQVLRKSGFKKVAA